VKKQPSLASLGIKPIVLLSHAGFLLIGAVNTLLGPMLPLLEVRWRMGDAQAGRLFIAQFIGGMFGSALSSPLIRRLTFLPLLAVGFGLMSAAIAILAVSNWEAGLMAIFGSGLALGLTIPTTNLLTAAVYPERRAAALNVLNLLWGLGAVINPLFITLLARDGRLSWPLLSLAALLALLALALARCHLESRLEFRLQPVFFDYGSQKLAQAGALDSCACLNNFSKTEHKPSSIHAWLSSYAMLIGALIFIYSGTEAATGGWIASYAQRLSAATPRGWALAQSLFWGGLLVGRATAPVFLGAVSGEKLVLLGLLIASGGVSLILAGDGLSLISAGAALSGFGLAPVFPTTLASFTHYFGTRASQLAGFLFVLASLGGAVIPWIVGVVSARYGELRFGLLLPLCCLIVMIVLQLALIARSARAGADNQAIHNATIN
jgi:fucose permease